MEKEKSGSSRTEVLDQLHFLSKATYGAYDDFKNHDPESALSSIESIDERLDHIREQVKEHTDGDVSGGCKEMYRFDKSEWNIIEREGVYFLIADPLRNRTEDSPEEIPIEEANQAMQQFLEQNRERTEELRGIVDQLRGQKDE